MISHAWTFVQADANALPLADASIDVIIADPPYEAGSHRRKPRSKVGMTFADVGYVEFVNRDWMKEAFRVLKRTGYLYLVIPVRELGAYLKRWPKYDSIISWYAPNALSLASKWIRNAGGRAFVWRPIVVYKGPDAKPFDWKRGGLVQGNYIEASQIQQGMREAQAWPNQIPLKVVNYLLAPHSAGGVVLDLFSGSGTTGAAAMGFGLTCVSIDLAPQALQLGRRRGPTAPLDLDYDGGTVMRHFIAEAVI